MGTVYRQFGGGPPLFTVTGGQVYAAYGGGVPLATVKGDSVYAGYGFGPPIARLYGNFVHEGFAGSLLFSVQGQQVYAGLGGGLPLLTGAGCSAVELAACAVLLQSRPLLPNKLSPQRGLGEETRPQ